MRRAPACCARYGGRLPAHAGLVQKMLLCGATVPGVDDGGGEGGICEQNAGLSVQERFPA